MHAVRRLGAVSARRHRLYVGALVPPLRNTTSATFSAITPNLSWNESNARAPPSKGEVVHWYLNSSVALVCPQSEQWAKGSPSFTLCRSFATAANGERDHTTDKLPVENDTAIPDNVETVVESEPMLEDASNVWKELTPEEASAAEAVSQLIWYYPTTQVMNLVHLTHDVTGISYALSIATVTVIMRSAMFPLAVLTRKNQSLRDEMQPEIKQILERGGQQKQRQLRALYDRYGYVRGARFVLPAVSISSFLVMFFGLRWMGYYYPADMVAGGELWFTDLSKPDPTRFLPILSVTNFLLMGELGADDLGRPMEYSRKWKWFWRCFRLAMLPLFLEMPAAVFCFWIPNSLVSIGQAIILSQPAVAKYFGIRQDRSTAMKASQIEGRKVIMYYDSASRSTQEPGGEGVESSKASDDGVREQPLSKQKLHKQLKAKASKRKGKGKAR